MAQNFPHELIGMLCLYPEVRQDFLRKVPQIEGNNYVRTSVDCRSEYMTVILVWKHERLDEVFIARNKAITYCRVHQRSRARESFGGECGIVLADVSNPLVVYGVRPSRTD